MSEDILLPARPVSGDVVIITIDDESINRIGQWPWPRKVFADAFLKINNQAPLALGLDVIFAEPSRVGSADDQYLADALKQLKYPIVMPVESENLLLNYNAPSRATRLLYPLEIFRQKNVSLGHANIITDKDGVVRRIPWQIQTSGILPELYDSFAYATVEQSGKEILNKESLWSIDKIAFAAPTGVIRRIPFWRVMEQDVGSMLANKILFVGVFTADLHDAKPTPMAKEKDMPGVEIQASIANMLLMNYRLKTLSGVATFVWILLAAFIPAIFFFFFKRSRVAVVLSVVLGAVYFFAIVFLFQYGISVNLIHISLAWILSTIVLFGYRHFVAERERRGLKNVFSKYASKEVVSEILKDPGRVKLGGEEKEITIFFSDIRSFTTWSEQTTPKKLVSILNRYFTAMSEEVLNNGGVLDKYIGDAIMAFWGAPIGDPEQADKAITASLSMLEKLKKLNVELKAEGEPEIKIGIGLFTGPAVVGNVGSEKRFNYTAIGDTVNVGSRLEGLTKEYNVQLVIGETTKNRAKGSYNFKFLASAAVKGRVEPINIYTIEV